MSVALSEHLPLLATAPDGIRKLRGLILELAVRGKLVPQDAEDEPAAVLLERIAQEKGRLNIGNAGKRGKSTPPVGTGDRPFELPAGWIWTRLAEIALINPRNAAEDSAVVSFVPMAMIGTRFEGTHEQELRTWAEVKQGFTHFSEGDVGFAKITPCFENSKACVFSGLSNGIGAGTTELHIVRPIANTLVSRYVLAYLKAPMFLQVGEARMTGTAGQKRLPKDFLEQNPFPLPPLAEQHRIVAKVDELMALCDRLETEQVDAEAAHARLVETLLATLTQSADAAELAANWRRLAGHFDTLLTTEAAIDALKQTVLQLAVMGKLVPQDAEEEPAEELLKRIAAQKKSKTCDEYAQPSMLDLPSGWFAVSLNDYALGVFTGPFGSVLHQSDYTSGGIPLVNPSHMINDKIVPDDRVTVSRAIAEQLSSYQLAAGDIVMARRGEVGRAALVEVSQVGWLCGTGSFFLRFSSEVNREYLLLILRSSAMRSYLAGRAVGTTMVNLNHGILKQAPLAIPPLPEQHRIVAKVDELMALCDRLKADLATARQRQATLADTLIAAALEAA